MMKNLLPAILILLVFQSAYAQDNYSYNNNNLYRSNRTKVRLGFKFDPSLTWLNSKDKIAQKDGSRIGFSYGFMMDIEFNENATLSTGAEIDNQGGKLKYPNGSGLFDQTGGSGTNSYNLRVQYLEIPVALKLSTNPVNKIIYWGQFGSYLDFKIGGRMNGTVDGTSYDNKNIAYSINPFNIGLLIGAGIEYPLGGRTRGVVGLTLHNGFTDITRNSKWNQDGKVVLNTFALRLGLFF